MVKDETEQLFAGRYRKGEPLGDSRLYNASVYKAYDTDQEDSPVAVKILRLNYSSDHEKSIAWSMFKKEVGALEGIEHEAIVSLLDQFYDRDEAGIVLELIEGGQTLEDIIELAQKDAKKRKPLQWKVAQLIRILDALSYTHQRQIVHRDVKLRNILYDRSKDALKLVDFGVARLAGQFMMDVRTLPYHMSPPFCAPEQRDHQVARKQADLYAFGIVIAALLTDKIPDSSFKRSDLASFLDPLRAHIAKPEVYELLLDTLDRLLDDSPEVRPDRWEIQRALDTLQGNLTHRPEATICIGLKDKQRIEANFGLMDFMADLNDGLHATCERREGNATYTFILYGKSVWLEAIQSEDDGDRLDFRRFGRIKIVEQAARRDHAASVPHRIKLAATGNAYEFINFVYEQHLIDIEISTNRERREDFLQISSAYLDLREAQVKELWLGCHWISGQRPNTGDIRDSANEYTLIPNDCIVLGVSAASREFPENDEISIDEDVSARLIEFAETFDRSANISYRNKILGRIIHVDLEQRAITVEVSFDMRIKIPPIAQVGENQESRIFVVKNDGLEKALRRERDAIENFIAGDTTNARLPELLLKPRLNRLNEIKSRPLLREGLKPAAQVRELIEHALASKDIYAIQGPPGTGKTTTITEAILQILKETPSARILLTSQNNDAVDNAMQKIVEVAKKINMPVRMLREVSDLRNRPNPLAFGATFNSWISTTAAKSINATSGELPIKITCNQKQEESIRAALKNWQDQLRVAEDIRDDFLLNIQVFGVTCLRLPALFKRYSHLQDMSFDWIIVDESARAHASELLVALNKGQRIILVGDQQQLPPHFDQKDLKELEQKYKRIDINTSLFEKLFNTLPGTNRIRLNLQFRMHESIARLISTLYYANDGESLATDTSASDMSLPIELFERPHRVFWIDIQGEQEEKEGSSSKQNRLEARRIRELLDKLETQAKRARPGYSPQRLTVAVITPYELQKQLLYHEIVPDASAHWRMLDIHIDTIDAFQGKQADIVILSLVSTKGGNNKFIGDPNRLNVAFSRAQRLLIIVGDIARAKRDGELRRVIEAIPSVNYIQSSVSK